MGLSDVQNKVVPMPAFTDPNLPEAAGGSINFGVAGDFPDFGEHPVEHSDDYGVAHAYTGDDLGLTAVDDDEADEVDPEDRAHWLKPQWVELAQAYELPHSGTVDDLRDRIEEYEKQHNGGES